MKLVLFGSFVVLFAQSALALATLESAQREKPSLFSRRDAVRNAAFVVGAVSLPVASFAESDLTGFSDGPKGIKYLILKEGEGEPPVRAQQVFTKYTLWTGGFGEDGGKQVDSNTGFLGRPLSVIVGVGRVIKGWDLTLLEMKKGEIRRLVIPPEMGYGEQGAGGDIPPNATLYFEVEVVGMDRMIEMNDSQKKWLEDNPL